MEPTLANSAVLEAKVHVEAALDHERSGSPNDLIVSFRKREQEHLTEAEERHLKALSVKGIMGNLFFLYHPPFFYENREDCGKEVHAGHVSKWTTFLLVETLLAAIAIQPLVAQTSLQGWKLSLYGLVWMLTLLASFVGMVVNAALLGHLLHCPLKLAWIWLCKLGYVSEIPRLVMWISSVICFLAIGYTTWAIYGAAIGIPCAVIELGVVIFTKWLMLRLKITLEETYEIR